MSNKCEVLKLGSVKEEFKYLIGLDYAKAKEELKEKGLILRAVEQAGYCLMVTCDYRSNRINVATSQDNVITGIVKIG